MRFYLSLTITMTFTFLFSNYSFAENEGILNRLLAPGPLISGHKELEGTDCLKCHDAGKGVPNEKCLDCHKDIRQSYNTKTGFHGLNRDSCIKCHGDHKGRDFDSTKFELKSFDHTKTGFSLDGKHNELKCNECHLEKKKGSNTLRFIGQRSTCNSCHKKDDPHYFKTEWAAKDCNACHGLKSWKQEIKFNHSNDTRFRLEGKHAEMKCSECHFNNKKISKYEWPDLKQKQCLSCHSDYHKNNLSPKFRAGNCTECHSQKSWKLSQFDHKATGYLLKGKHEDLKCSECHKQTQKKWTGLKSECLSCHKDYHFFGSQKTAKHGLLNKCESCHDETSWNKTHDFNHNSQTRFPIEGKHLKLDCNKCHLNNSLKAKKPIVGNYQWKDLNSKTCEVCHESPHLKSFKPELLKKRCTECHVADGWKVTPQKVKFDHEATRFSLTGKHKELVCSACHIENKQQVFKFPSHDLKFCNDCHKTPHKGQFSNKFNEKSCSDCHNTINWKERLKFNHNETSFALANEHSKLKCSECHTLTNEFFNTQPPKQKSKFLFPEFRTKDCSTCHKDFHRGQLSERCSECHTDKNWKPSQFEHNQQSQFLLKGKHLNTSCNECHKVIKNTFVTWKNQTIQTVRYKPMSSECKDCHEDTHKGNFGKACNECHIEREWKITKDFHRNFTLRGVHFTVECAECHKNNRRLSGLSDQCQNCHQKDDIHNGTLPKCSECHKQQFWENADFKHSTSNFPLRGMHRTLECASCHIRGIYSGTSSRCIDCHLSDAQGVSAHPNPVPTFENCNRCHNQFSF